MAYPFSGKCGFVAVVISVLSFSAAANADTVLLEDGSRLPGSVIGLKNGKLAIETNYAGRIEIPANKIVAITTDGIVTVRFTAGGYATGRLRSPYSGAIRILSGKGGSPASVKLENISEIHPGSEIPRGLTWKGHLNIGASLLSGNTDSESFRADGSAIARAEKDRIKARSDFNRETDSGSEIEDNYTLSLQHDRFVSKKIFFYTNVKLEHDDIALLDLRTTLGTGLGRQIIESDLTNLSIEAGPGYIIENFQGRPNNESVVGRWALDYDQYVWKELIQLFHRHEGLADIEETGNVLVDSSTGLRLFVRDGLNITLQLDIDWTNRPPSGVSSLDKKYMLTVGYKW